MERAAPALPPHASARVRRAVGRHLRSSDASRVIYGAIIGLALVLALERHPPGMGVTAATLIATAVAVALAELYSEILGFAVRERHHAHRADVRRLAHGAAALGAGAAFPALYFVVAATTSMDSATAFWLAKWTGLGLIAGYAFFAARASGQRPAMALLHAAAVTAIGALLIGAKALLH